MEHPNKTAEEMLWEAICALAANPNMITIAQDRFVPGKASLQMQPPQIFLQMAQNIIGMYLAVEHKPQVESETFEPASKADNTTIINDSEKNGASQEAQRPFEVHG